MFLNQNDDQKPIDTNDQIEGVSDVDILYHLRGLDAAAPLKATGGTQDSPLLSLLSFITLTPLSTGMYNLSHGICGLTWVIPGHLISLR